MCARRSDTHTQISTDEAKLLLPCPFCGNMGLEKLTGDEEGTDCFWLVQTSYGSCHIRCYKCSCAPDSFAKSFEEAVKFWNSRASFSGTDEFRRGAFYMSSKLKQDIESSFNHIFDDIDLDSNASS